ncbi:putative protein of unknown function (DUF4457) [Trypanosoma vivax]|uniref:KATNIP domain-containing protein n=1 Tax=Trypanosoma vivax (strain Y486) TaxID=1055687 RepID=G0U1V6_TRYVY|nr:hypothetical protein TRVL_05481 [Trypanosoma vivax]KAH8618662.1 putative protein of unknown function (DUF4457) [Trypanosoma vivax]CCC50255.1 conserved hypothetical protein [Trypanosoma vivax Y486]
MPNPYSCTGPRGPDITSSSTVAADGRRELSTRNASDYDEYPQGNQLRSRVRGAVEKSLASPVQVRSASSLADGDAVNELCSLLTGDNSPISPFETSQGDASLNLLSQVSADLNRKMSGQIPFSCVSPCDVDRSPVSPDLNTPPSLRSVPNCEPALGKSNANNEFSLDPYLADRMPRGRFIMLNLLSTWGDLHEVGLNGIEVFNEDGERIIPFPDLPRDSSPEQQRQCQMEERRRVDGGVATVSYSLPNNRLLIVVEHPEANELVAPGGCSGAVYGEGNGFDTSCRGGESTDPDTLTAFVDPRRCVANLVNGINNTHDETRLFVMPFTPDNHHLVGFILPTAVTISMVRLYNYGGHGRVHTSKGVRLLEMTVDDQLVFRGEIAQNTGEVIVPTQVGLRNCENILFTEDRAVLQRMFSGRNDAMVSDAAVSAGLQNADGLTDAAFPQCVVDSTPSSTPTTLLLSCSTENKSRLFGGERSVVFCNTQRPNAVNVGAKTPQVAQPCIGRPYVSECPQNVTSVCLMLLGTWGDTEKIGLSGLRLRDARGDLVSQAITHWFVRFPSQVARANADGFKGHEDADVWADQLPYLFDENASTAMTLPCERGVEIIFIFAEPLPTLGFLEVANYSQGEHTFCGVKEARLFISSADYSTNAASCSPNSFVAAYASLWFNDRSPSRSAIAAHGIYEVTPEEGVSLRKAPAFLSVPRFQVYDLSFSGGVPSVAPGAALCGGNPLRRSLSRSLSASMNIRAEMSMRRARMALKPRPKWLLEYQPYLTPLLPVAYVVKVSLTICAKGAVELKNYAKEWMLNPMRSCTFADESGERISVGGEGTKPRDSERGGACLTTGESSIMGGRGGPRTSCPGRSGDTNADVIRNNIQTECLFTALPNAVHQDADAAKAAALAGIRVSLLHANVSLVYVADTPICISILSLNRALVADRRVAWVKQLRVHMDDTLVFDSGDVGVPQPVQDQAPAVLPHQNQASDARRTSCGSGDQARYRTKLKSFVFFTLDSALLEEARDEVTRMAS